MGAQFVFFYLVSLLLAVEYPRPALYVACLYLYSVIRSICASRRRW